jgi:hypothetical protein
MHRSSYVPDTLAGARYRLISETLLIELYDAEILELPCLGAGDLDAAKFQHEVIEAATRMASFFGMASPCSVLELVRSDFRLTAEEMVEMKKLSLAMVPIMSFDRDAMQEVLRYRLLMLRVRQVVN